MNENEHNFEALRRLLTLKRHEIPPPGYFENFSDGVIARIRAGEAVRELPWLLRFLQAIESRPAFPVAFASSLCFLLLFGIVSIEQNPEVVGMQQPSFLVGQNNGSGSFTSFSENSLTPVSSTPRFIGDTNPPVSLSPALFGSQASPVSFQQADYSPAGN